MKLFLAAVTFWALWKFVFTSRILFLGSIGPRSHKIYFDGIVNALLNAGHQVTLITAHSTTHEPNKNLTEIIIKDYYKQFMNKNPFETDFWDLIKMHAEAMPVMCTKTLTETDVIRKEFSEDYDLIIASILFSECYFPYIYKKNVPVVLASIIMIQSYFSEIMGNIEFPSVVPSLFQEAVHPISFSQRLFSALFATTSYYSMTKRSYPKIEEEMKDKGVWPSEDVPSIAETMTQSAGFMIVNGVKALEYPSRPYSPNIIFAGGIHIRPTLPLNKEIADWVEGSGDDGLILFSLGSVTDTKYIRKKYLEIFLKVFASLRQRILWKWDAEPIENLPTNIKLSKWLPQTDLLAHPKTKLFISHGGFLSTQEATYHGVPLLGMPVFLDQKLNMYRAAAEGWAQALNWNELTEKKLKREINSALNNASLSEMVLKRSNLMKDLPMSPSREVAYWMEYIIRHKGAHHLRPPFRNMSWYKIYNMDVWATIFITLLTAILLIVYIISICCRRCFARKIVKAKTH